MRTVTVAIGFDDHISVYEVPVEMFDELHISPTSYDAADLIVADCDHVDYYDEGQLFLDTTSDNIEDFRYNLEELEEELGL